MLFRSLTAGFQAKFYMLMAAVENGQQFWLVIFAVLMAAVSAYYYFRVIQAMYFKEPGTSSLVNSAGNSGFQALLVVLAILILVLGVYPEFLIGWMYHL